MLSHGQKTAYSVNTATPQTATAQTSTAQPSDPGRIITVFEKNNMDAGMHRTPTPTITTIYAPTPNPLAGLITTTSTLSANHPPATLPTSLPPMGSYANAVNGLTAQQASVQPGLHEKVPVFLDPAMAGQLSAILAGVSRQPALTLQ